MARRHVERLPLVTEDAPDDFGLVDERDQAHRVPAPGTGQHVEPKAVSARVALSSHALGPARRVPGEFVEVLRVASHGQFQF